MNDQTREPDAPSETNNGIIDIEEYGKTGKQPDKGSKSALPSSVGNVKIESVEPLKLSERESRLLGELCDWQRQSARSDYMFTDQSSCAVDRFRNLAIMQSISVLCPPAKGAKY